jgi:hypothetical protein
MVILDDSDIAPTHVVEITYVDGRVEREGPAPEVVAQAAAAAYRGQPEVKSVRVVRVSE